MPKRGKDRQETQRSLNRFKGSTYDLVGEDGQPIHPVCDEFSGSHRGVEQPSNLPNKAIKKDKNRQKGSPESE